MAVPSSQAPLTILHSETTDVKHEVWLQNIMFWWLKETLWEVLVC